MGWWSEEGFSGQPEPKSATGGETLYRVWGADATRMWGDPGRRGLCFSRDRPTVRSDAERLFAVMEYGNPCIHMASFTMAKDTPYWEGQVDAGAPECSPGPSGSQIFIERQYLSNVSAGPVTRLADDMDGAVVLRRPDTGISH